MQEDTRYKTFWRRFGASSVDTAILGPVHTAVALVAYAALASLSDWRWLAAGEIAGAATLVYSIVMHARGGQTIGKMATGVRVVSARSEGPIRPVQAVLREVPNIAIWAVTTAILWNFLAKDISEIVWQTPDGQVHADQGALIAVGLAASIGLAWTVLEALTMLTNPRRRAIHDFVAGTVVVQTRFEHQRWPATHPDKVELTEERVQALNADSPGALQPLVAGWYTNPTYLVAWPRVGAAFIDGFTSLGLWGLVAAVMAPFGFTYIPIAFVAMLVYGAYDTLCHAAWGQTLGKLVTKIAVVDAATLMSPTLRQAALRAVNIWWTALAFLITNIVLRVESDGRAFPIGIDEWLLGSFICMLVTPQRRALHDLLAGTTVIREEDVVHVAPPVTGQTGLTPVSSGW